MLFLELVVSLPLTGAIWLENGTNFARVQGKTVLEKSTTELWILHLLIEHWLKWIGHWDISNFKWLESNPSKTFHVFYVESHSNSFSSSIKYNSTTNLNFSLSLTTSVCQHSYKNSSHSNQLEKERFFPSFAKLPFPSCAEIRLGIFQIKSVGTH